ncbi:MAG TPA: aldolase/citrate lyase family protein [Bryobacteraceae bacterium]|nr:aldolase/citrate lyase family protein [Bryobacteraceae bacterium]
MRINTVKKALAEGKVQLGTGFGQLRSQDVARILAAAGFNWAFVDTEHGGFGIETVQDICRITNYVSLAPIVRVADMQYDLVARALDSGAAGVIFPRVESCELLERAVSWTKFPPLGIRGFGLTPLYTDFEKVTIAQMIEHINANTMVVLQIETKRALDMRDELLSVPGIDAVMVGPVDLSISLGVPGDFMHPTMVDAMEEIRDSCVAHGVTPGTQTRALPMARFWKERGMRFLGTNNDTGMLFEKASELVKEMLA